jgi:hypothetical protein
MLSSLVREHNQRQSERRQEQELKRREAAKASAELTQAVVDHLNVGAAQAYLNQVRPILATLTKFKF